MEVNKRKLTGVWNHQVWFEVKSQIKPGFPLSSTGQRSEHCVGTRTENRPFSVLFLFLDEWLTTCSLSGDLEANSSKMTVTNLTIPQVLVFKRIDF
jgi:hypothetical protein